MKKFTVIFLSFIYCDIYFVENNNMIGTAFIEYEPYNITEDVKGLYRFEIHADIDYSTIRQ